MRSFQYHPLVLYTAAVLALEGVTWLASQAADRPSLHIKRYHAFAVGGAVVTVANWIFKNYMLVALGVDLLLPM